MAIDDRYVIVATHHYYGPRDEQCLYSGGGRYDPGIAYADQAAAARAVARLERERYVLNSNESERPDYRVVAVRDLRGGLRDFLPAPHQVTATTTPAGVELMLHRCGLSQTEAAHYLGVQPRLVRRWISGERYPSGQLILPTEAHWQRLVELCARQDQAAAEMIETLRSKSADRMLVEMARTQEDADRLGWPCPGAHVAVVRRVVERAPKSMTIAPVHSGA